MTPRRWLMAVAKVAVFALVVWCVRGSLSAGLAQLRQHPIELDYGWLVVAAVLYVGGAAPAAWFWYRVLLVLGQKVTIRAAMRAHFIGHLGKYVPGKAMVVVLRSGLVQGPETRAAVAATAVFYETLTMMGVGAFLAAAMLALFVRDSGWLLLVALGLMVASTLSTLPPVFCRLARWAGVARGDTVVEQRLAALGWNTMLTGWLANTVGWLLMAASLAAVLVAAGVDTASVVEHWPLCLATVTLSVVAGFLSLIPGGAGVREAVIMELLAKNLTGGAVAIVAAVLLRIVWLVSEVGVSSILYLCGAGQGVPASDDADT